METDKIKLQEIILDSQLAQTNKRLLLEMVSNLADEDIASLAELAESNPSILLELSNHIHKKIIYLSEDTASLEELIKSGEKISHLTDK